MTDTERRRLSAYWYAVGIYEHVPGAIDVAHEFGEFARDQALMYYGSRTTFLASVGGQWQEFVTALRQLNPEAFMTESQPFNLATGEFGGVYTLPPREAVIAAHAQALGDFNTWDYEARYGELVVDFFASDGRHVVTCGDWTCGP